METRKRKTLLSPQEVIELKKLYKEGTSAKDLQLLFDLSASGVYYILNRKEEARDRTKYNSKISLEDRNNIGELFKNGTPVGQIALKYNVATASIYHHLHRMGLMNKNDHQIAKDSAHKAFTPPLLEPTMIKEKQDTIMEHINPPKRTIASPLLMAINHKPTTQDKAAFGTQVLDLQERQLYVQMNHDTQNPLWVPIEPERKGMLTRIKGWFK